MTVGTGTHLSAHILLEGCRGCPPAVDLPVKGCDNEEAAGNGVHVGLQDGRLVGPSKGPAHVAGRVPKQELMSLHSAVPVLLSLALQTLKAIQAKRKISVVVLIKLEFWPNMDLDPDPGLCYQFRKKKKIV